MKIKKYILRILAALLILSLSQIPAAFHPVLGEEANDIKIYKLWYDSEAPQSMHGFERLSLPLGNGYMGINVFGGLESELITVTENSMFNPWTKCTSADGPFGQDRMDASAGGLNILAWTHIDFDHEGAENYRRELLLNDATAKVRYDHEGITYTRDYFTSYPDKVAVVRLTASEPGAISFTLRPEAPYCYDPEVSDDYSYLDTPNDGYTKSGVVTAAGDTVTVKGTMAHYNINYEGLFKVIPEGGTMEAHNDANGKNGSITVTDANSVLILMAVGTNYRLESETFTSADKNKLDSREDPHEKVQGYMDAAASKNYSQLLDTHREDYQELFDRAQLDLGGVYSDEITTEQLVKNYRNGIYDPYLEEIVFQYGRYLLIASSRTGCLPGNLQGIWNFGDTAAWSGGYWHNINVQMNYWPAFSTGLSELFESYVDYNEAMRPAAQSNADRYLTQIKAPTIAAAGTGENGYAIGTGCTPYQCASPSVGSHSGPGTGAFTSLLFWDYYDYTRDEKILEEHTYPALEGMAKFLSKTLKEYEDGKWLVYQSASPENANSYQTVGCAFDQQMVYANHLATLQAAELLGYTEEDYPILATIREQLDHLDPVNIGYSGQVKEYREENYYGEIGESTHRHISQLVGIYPATVINGTTEAWLEAAGVSLENRGTSIYGWSNAHRMLCWARIQDAEKAYEHLQTLLEINTAYNLWGDYSTDNNNDPFQLDSNCGYTAGVAEMLVQSHAGYIEFLPALPSAWSNGSFQGMTVRGNFAVDAAWENGIATSFAIESRSGGACSVKYPNLSQAVVKDSQGNAVAFTVEEQDLICFQTVAGESYTVESIPTHTPGLDAPSSLNISEENGVITLNWTANEGAVSYNIYRALNDDPNYTLIEAGVTDTSYTYAPTDVQNADRMTLRVTAVSADGTESPGALGYSLPVHSLESVKACFFGKDLQLNYAHQDGADGYRIYADGVQVATSRYPIAVVENADSSKTYSVTVVVAGKESAACVAQVQTDRVANRIALCQALNRYGGQDTSSASFAGTPVAYALAEKQAETVLLDTSATQEQIDIAAANMILAASRANIFHNRPITADKACVPGYTAAKMVDENTSTRYAMHTVGNEELGLDSVTVTVQLDAVYNLEALFVQEFLNVHETASRAKSVKLEVYDGGAWKEVFAGGVLSSTNRDAANNKAVNTGFILDTPVRASQVRITFTHYAGDGSTNTNLMSIWEVQAYGERLTASLADLKAAIAQYGNLDVNSGSFAGTPVAYTLAKNQATQVAANSSATLEQIDAATINLINAATRENIFRNRPVTADKACVPGYTAAKMVDESCVEPSRYAMHIAGNASTSLDSVTVTVQLDAVYNLEALFVQEFLNVHETASRAKSVKLEVYAGGTWQEVFANGLLSSANRDASNSKAVNTGFIFDTPVKASQVRITFTHYAGDGTTNTNLMTIWELQAYGEKLTATREELQNAYDRYGNLDITAESFAGTPVAYTIAKAQAKAVLADANATYEQIGATFTALVNAATRQNIFYGRPIEASKAWVNGYPAEKMVDESSSTRYAMHTVGNEALGLGDVAFTLELDGVYVLDAVFVQEFLNTYETSTRAKNVKLEVYYGAQWTEVFADGVLSSTARDPSNNKAVNTGFFLDTPVKASQVRITFTHFEGDGSTNTNLMSIWELQAYGKKIADVDTVALEQAIADARKALSGVIVMDREPANVLAGIRFTSQTQLQAMEAALKEAELALYDIRENAVADQWAQTLSGKTAAFLATVQVGTQPDDHNHCHCVGTAEHTCQNVKWTPWGDEPNELSSLPTASGNYYLVSSITVSNETYVPYGAEISLCFNGFSITCTGDQVYSVGGVVNICDCFETPGQACGNSTDDGGTIFVCDKGLLRIFGGSFTGSAAAENGGVLYVAKGGKLEMYGGTVTGGSAKYGGNIYVFTGGDMKLYGGLVTGGNASSYGGNIYTNTNATMEMHGGSILAGQAGNGANLYVGGPLTFSGGIIGDGIKGANILLQSEANMTVTGGTIRGSNSGNIRIWDSGTFTMTGGTLLCTDYAGMGGNILADKGGSVTISGGSVTGSPVSDIAVNMIAEVEGANNNAKKPAALTVENAVVGSVYLGDSNERYDPVVSFSGSAQIEKVIRGGSTKPMIFLNLTEGAKVMFTGETDGEVFGTGRPDYVHSDNGLQILAEEENLKWFFPAPIELKILGQPEDVTGALGTTVPVTVSAQGTDLTYKWQYSIDGGKSWYASKSFEGRDSDILYIPVTAAREGFLYRCVITDGNGNRVVTDAAKLSATTGVSGQPEDVTASVGETVPFTVSVTGVEIASYKWQYSTNGGQCWFASKTFEGRNSDTLYVPVAANRDGFLYRCVLTTVDGEVIITDVAELIVQ